MAKPNQNTGRNQTAESNQVALVTGGAKRVGRAIALELARAGFDIAVHCNTSTAEAEECCTQIRDTGRRATVVRADLAQMNSPDDLIDQTVQSLGRLDVLINNAAIFEKDPDGPFDSAHWNRMMTVNTLAPAALIEAAAPHLQRDGRGKVVNICDISADRPWPDYAAYCASKAALVNLTRSFARRLAPEIQVNGVSPGIAVFPDHYDAATRDRLIRRVPLRRAGRPEDIAQAVRFLVTSGDYITGQIISVDGGRSIV